MTKSRYLQRAGRRGKWNAQRNAIGMAGQLGAHSYMTKAVVAALTQAAQMRQQRGSR